MTTLVFILKVLLISGIAIAATISIGFAIGYLVAALRDLWWLRRYRRGK